MARSKKNRIQLSDADVKKLQGILKNKNTSPTIANRCRILLALDENHPPMKTYDQCMAFFCISRPTITNVARTYAQDGLDTVLKLKRSVNSNNAHRKVDGHMEAQIVEIACALSQKAIAVGQSGFLKNRPRLSLRNPSAGKPSEAY